MIRDIFKTNKPVYSIEVFPPKKTADIDSIYHTLDEFKTLNPSFISVTYGAGGSTSGLTADIASYIQNECGVEALSHLTCASLHRPSDLTDFLRKLNASGVHNILTLRGDKPRDMSEEDFNNRLYAHASDLASAITAHDTFTLAGACYPEKHPQALSLQDDIRALHHKVEKGVEFLITQLFFDNEKFYRFLELTRAEGIHVPITAGLMPITAKSQIKNIIALSESSIPSELQIILGKYMDSPDDLRKAGLEYTKKQMDDLLQHGVDGIHIYSMNKVEIAKYLLQ